MESEASERCRLPTGGEQQLPSRGTVETGELNERKREVRRQPQDQARRPSVRQIDRRPWRDGQRGPAGNG